MFRRIASTVVAHPWQVIVAWVSATVLLVSFAPTLDEVANADQTSFLPDSYPSVAAQEFAEAAFPQQTGGASALFVVSSGDGGALTPAQRQEVGELAAELQGAGIERVRAVVTGPEQVAPDGSAQLVQVAFEGLSQDVPVQEAVGELRERADAAVEGTGLQAQLTGEAALLVDSQQAFTDAEQITLVATFGLILGMLLAIFRSPVAALMPLLAVSLVFAAATALIGLAAEGFGFQASPELTSLLVVVLFGIGTDYILFLLFRLRERLRAGDEPKDALRHAVERVGRVIGSAALVVIVSFGALLLSELESFEAMAPGLTIAVAVMLLAALTLVPAIVSLIGTHVFWPSRSWQHRPTGTIAKRIGRFVARRAGLTALASGGVLVALAAGAFAYQPNYDSVDQLPSGTESAEAFQALDRAFPAGALNPTLVYVRGDAALQPAELAALSERLSGVEGVAGVGRPQPSRTGTAAQIPVILAAGPYSSEALDTVSGPLRQAAEASGAGAEVFVGGTTAAFADVRDATNRDFTVVFPVAAGLILVILVVLLRALVAPLYLLLAVGLGFAATLGASVAVFQGIGDQVGLMFSLPIILYLFVVAIGTDYNILMIDRLREEADDGHDPRTAADLAIEHAGPTVVAAGVILAGTFASLMLTGVSLLVQLGFAVSAGIVLAAFVMAGLFVPSLTGVVGQAAWWPRRVGRAAPVRTASAGATAPEPAGEEPAAVGGR